MRTKLDASDHDKKHRSGPPGHEDMRTQTTASFSPASDTSRFGEQRMIPSTGMRRDTYGFVRSRRGKYLYVRRIGEPSWPTWLVCQPGLEESVHARSALASLAMRFASRGVSSLSVDFEGDGHSDGNVSDVGLTEWTDDAMDALVASPVSLDTILGIRLGAAVALRVAARVVPRRIVLLDPVADGEAWLMQALRSNLTTQLTAFRKVIESRNDMYARVLRGNGTCNIAGYEVGQRFVQSVISSTPIAAAAEIIALRGLMQVFVVYSNDATANAAPDFTRALGSQVDVRNVGSRDPAVWAEGAMSGSQCEALQDLMLKLATA